MKMDGKTRGQTKSEKWSKMKTKSVFFFVCFLFSWAFAEKPLTILEFVKSNRELMPIEMKKDLDAAIVEHSLEKWPVSDPWPEEVKLANVVQNAIDKSVQVHTKRTVKKENVYYISIEGERQSLSIDVTVYKSTTLAQAEAFFGSMKTGVTKSVKIEPEDIPNLVVLTFNDNAVVYVYRNIYFQVNRSVKKDSATGEKFVVTPLNDEKGMMGILHQELISKAKVYND